MTRCIQPEWLDELPPSDPRAIQSRRDLKKINAWMCNATWLADEFNAQPDRPQRLLELGAGDGTLLLRVIDKMKRPDRMEVTLLDQQNLLTPEIRELYAQRGADVQVRQQSVLAWAAESSSENYDAILCNLFLHHFREQELKLIFRKISQSCRFFVACEPVRSIPAIFCTRLLWLIGCNEVTRHDALLSVEAGFCGNDISRLWPKDPNWLLTEKPGGYTSHVFAAVRQNG